MEYDALQHVTEEEMKTFCRGQMKPSSQMDRIERHISECGDCAREMARLTKESVSTINNFRDGMSTFPD